MRLLTILGLMLVIAGILLIIASMMKPIVVGTQEEAQVTGCIIILFIPVCFSGKGTALSLPIIMGIAFFVIALLLIIIMLYKVYKLVSSPTMPYGT
mgnify:CR=1 FL=1